MNGYPIKVTARFAIQGPCRTRTIGYRQFQVANYVLAYFAKNEVAPSYQTIREGTGIATRGEVCRIVKALERGGLLIRSGRGREPRITIQSANQLRDRPGVEL